MHIGICGFVGDAVKSGDIVLSTGSFKDTGATMLSPADPSEIDPVAYPDSELAAAIESQLNAVGMRHSIGMGYTIPIFYFQPADLIRDLITGEAFPSGPKVGYFEMEQASFLQTCKLMRKQSASMVVGADRYSLIDGELTHKFEDDVEQDAVKLNMIRTALRTFKLFA